MWAQNKFCPHTVPDCYVRFAALRNLSLPVFGQGFAPTPLAPVALRRCNHQNRAPYIGAYGALC